MTTHPIIRAIRVIHSNPRSNIDGQRAHAMIKHSIIRGKSALQCRWPATDRRPTISGWHHFSLADGMEPNVRVVYDPKDRPADSPSMENFKQISRLLDSKFEIPGTGIRFGLDPIFSLMPFLGDLITLVISSMLIYTMQKHGASRKVVVKMMINAGLDTVMGAIPVVGTVFDVFFKANERNVKLLREHYYEGKHQGSGTGLLILIFVIVLLMVAAIVYGLWKLFEWIF